MSGAILAQLIAQGVEEGAGLSTLRAVAEEAGELGASRALARLGLTDDRAAGDMRELRDLLAAWRDAKTSAWKAVIGWVSAAVLAALAVEMGFAELVG
jgi:hypothetical protein